MPIDTSALDALKGKKPARKRAVKEWKPLDLADLHPGAYLAADPSLSEFGIVVLTVPEPYSAGNPRRPIVMAAETFASKEGDFGTTGWEDMLNRAAMIEGYLGEWIAKWAHFYPDLIAVHEMPPMGGGKMASPESALLGSYAFRNACGHRFPRLKMVPRQRHADMVCGNANAKKAVVHAALKRDILPQLGGAELITNGGKRDALQVALYAALTRT